MNIALRLGSRVLGLTLPTAGWPNTLGPVHWQAWWVVFSQRARKVWSSQVPLVGEKRKMVLFLGIGPRFVNPGVCSSGQHLD